MEVGVERTLGLQVLVENAFEGEVADGVFHRWVGLQRHAPLQAVEVDAGHERLLGLVVGLLLDDGGEDDDVFES